MWSGQLSSREGDVIAGLGQTYMEDLERLQKLFCSTMTFLASPVCGHVSPKKDQELAKNGNFSGRFHGAYEQNLSELCGSAGNVMHLPVLHAPIGYQTHFKQALLLAP